MAVKNSPLTKTELKEVLSDFGAKLKIEIKEELLDDMIKLKDEIMGEIKAMREEQTILSGDHSRILDLEDNVEKLQKIHPHNKHIATL